MFKIFKNKHNERNKRHKRETNVTFRAENIMSEVKDSLDDCNCRLEENTQKKF